VRFLIEDLNFIRKDTVKCMLQPLHKVNGIWIYSVIGEILIHRVFVIHVCALNRHAVWYGNNPAQCVDLTRMRVVVFQTAAGMYLQLRFIYIYKVIHTHECSNHTHDCSNRKQFQNHTQGASITRMMWKSHSSFWYRTESASQNPIRNFQ
jgi:hypothetical protein